MAEEIKIVIGADSSDLSAQLAKAEKDLKKFQDTLKKSSDTKEIEALNKKIEETNAIINQLRSAVGKVTITADTTDLDNKVKNAQGELQQIQSPAPAQITADTTNIDAAVAKADAELQTIETPPPVNITADTTGIDTAVVKVDAELSQIQSPAPAQITADTTNIDAAVAKTDAELQTIETPPPVIINADINDLLTETEKAKMETESLQSPPPVQITADASTFNAELQKAENELRQFQAALKKTTDVNELAGLNQKIVETQKKIEGLNKSFQSIKPSTNAASGAVLNLSRIVQDSAFGFIGIANNIQPFIDSLGYARKEAQATGTSLGKNLLSVLTGAGGLSLAFAAVTTAITFAQIGFSAWTRSSKAAKDSADELANSLKDAEKSAISQGMRLEGLVAIITNSTQSERNRNLALKEANDLLKPYGEKIDSINVSVSEAKRLTDLYTEALINQAVGAKLADKIADLRLKKFEQENNLTQKQLTLAANKNKLSKESDALQKRQFGTSDRLGLQALQTNQEISNSEQDVIDAKDELIKTQIELNKLTSQYTATIVPTLKAQEQQTKTTKKVAEEFQKLKIAIPKLDLIKLNLPIEILPTPTVKEPQAVTDYIEKYKRQEIVDYINRFKDQFNFEVPVNFQFLPKDTLDKTFNDLKSRVDKFTKGIQDAFNQFTANVSAGLTSVFAESLGQALVGAISFGDVFKNIFSALGGYVEQLGKQLIEIGFLGILAQQALSQIILNPFAAIGVGIALTALGAAIKALTSQKYAVGTNYAPGGMALVGERGPELVNLPRGSQVIPAGRTASMMGGMGQQVEVFGMLRGQDIYFSNKKYGQTYGRTT